MRLAHIHITLVLSIMLAWTGLYGQGNGGQTQVASPSASSQKAIVRKAIVRNVKAILSNYLKPSQYAIDVNFDLPPEVNSYADIPYAPDSILPDAINLQSAENLMSKVQNLQVKVKLPRWINQQTSDTLKSIVDSNLKSSVEEGSFQLDFERVNLEIKDPANEGRTRVVLPPGLRPNQAQEQQRAQQEQVIADTRKALDDLKSQMAKEREDFSNQLNDMSKALEDAKQATQNGGGGSNKNSLQDMMEYAGENPIVAALIFLALYGAFFVLAFIPSKLLSSGLKGFQSGLTGIAKAMKSISEALGKGGSGNSGGGGSGGGAAAAPAAALPAQNTGGDEGDSAGGSGKGNNGDTYARLKELVEHIRMQYDDTIDQTALEFINQLLVTGDTEDQYSAVMSLELLGDEASDRIFGKLNEDQKQIIIETIENPPKKKGKAEVMLETAEKFNTKMMSRRWRTKKSDKLSNDVYINMRGLTIPNFANVLKILPEDAAKRFFLYLRAKQVADVVKILSKEAPDRDFITLVSNMPTVLEDTASDQVIIEMLTEEKAKQEDNKFAMYKDQFFKIVEQIGEDHEDEILNGIAASNPEVGKYLRQKIVTIGTFFLVDDEVRNEILQEFGNYDAAVLVSAFEGQQREILLNSFDDRRRDLVQEQLEMLVDESKLQLQEAQRRAKEKVKKGLKAMENVLDMTSLVNEELPEESSGSAA